ncbi:MAG: hypothetical protein Q8N69_02020 [bacterium]|nr:hypothetical protein [bacterium]
MFQSKNQERIEIDGWRVYDLPIKYNEADYDEARTAVINQVRNTPGLIALLEFGYITYPGISDMDFWAVFSDDAEKMYLPSQPEFSEKIKYLMKHQVMLITEKHYRKILYFSPWTKKYWPNGHKLLWKKEDVNRDINFDNIEFTKDEHDILSLASIEDYLTLMRSLLPLYTNKELPVRHVLELFKDCVYIIRDINLITDRKINPDFTKDIQDLRSNWFKIEEQQAIRRLIKIFHNGLLVFFEAAFSLGSWASQYSRPESIRNLGIKKTNFFNHSSLDKKAKNIFLNSFGDRRVYSDLVRTPLQALELSVRSYRQLKINLGRHSRAIDSFIFFMPYEAAAMFIGFVSESGLLSDSLKRDTFSNIEEVPVFKPEVFRERIKMVNEITEIYNRKQIPGTNGKGWFVGNNIFQYAFEHEKLGRKLLAFWLKRKFWRAIKTISHNLS